MQYSVFHIEGGIGKNIVATNIVRAIKKAHPERNLIVVAPYPEVFVHNPNIYRPKAINALITTMPVHSLTRIRLIESLKNCCN